MPAIKEIPLSKSESESFTFAEIGTITHFVLQYIPLRGNMDKDNIENEIKNMVMKKQLTAEEADNVDSSKLHRFYSSQLGKRMLSSGKVFREQPFIIRKSINDIIDFNEKTDEFVLVQGIIDCYFFEGDEIVLVDYKTDRVTGGDFDSLKNYYNPQITEYRNALEILTGKTVKESYLYLINHSKEIRMQ